MFKAEVIIIVIVVKQKNKERKLFTVHYFLCALLHEIPFDSGCYDDSPAHYAFYYAHLAQYI